MNFVVKRENRPKIRLNMTAITIPIMDSMHRSALFFQIAMLGLACWITYISTQVNRANLESSPIRITKAMMTIAIQARYHTHNAIPINVKKTVAINAPRIDPVMR